MMNEDAALRIVDQELDLALRGLTAPPHLASVVLHRVQRERLSRLPEILDFIGWAAILAVVMILLSKLTPINLIPYALLIVATVSVVVSLAFGVHSAQHLTRRD